MSRMGKRFCIGALAAMALAGCEVPPMESEQQGYRGTGMVQITNPRIDVPAGLVPAAQPPAAEGGPLAKDIYQNVQVLDDLSLAEFTRLMVALTEWVSPEQGCNYCHNPANLADDDIYTKVVSRRMLEMTRTINSGHAAHVGETGVTCYTCHRGLNVPAEIWAYDPGPRSARGLAGWRDGQNIAAPAVGLTSLPFDPFTRYLAAWPGAESPIRVGSTTALPTGANPRDIKDTEATYALMVHMSDALGVNCTACHNSRHFGSWEESTPIRVTALHGLSMVQRINETYLDPLQPALPPHRLGPTGDAPKAHCGTCHQGVRKPLNGAPMLADYPELAAP
jgi:photosynthetic reaction center cytochrome c subunit